MRLIFAGWHNAPWPKFLQRERVQNRLLSYIEAKERDLEQLLNPDGYVESNRKKEKQ